VFGHIHEAYGVMNVDGVQYVNCCMVNLKYMQVNKAFVIEVTKKEGDQENEKKIR